MGPYLRHKVAPQLKSWTVLQPLTWAKIRTLMIPCCLRTLSSWVWHFFASQLQKQRKIKVRAIGKWICVPFWESLDYAYCSDLIFKSTNFTLRNDLVLKMKYMITKILEYCNLYTNVSVILLLKIILHLKLPIRSKGLCLGKGKKCTMCKDGLSLDQVQHLIHR